MISKIRTRHFALLAMALTLSGCGIFGGGKGGPKTPTVGNRIPILSHIDTAANVDPALAFVEVLLPPAETNADWAQAGGTADKSYGHTALAENPRRIWNVGIAGSSNKRRLAASPVRSITPL